MLQRLGKLTVVFLLVFSTGGHWFLLQSVAWVKMTMSFAQDNPWPVALQKTFDGRHPCRICKVVAEGKEQERKKEILQAKVKLEFLCEQKPVLISPPVLADSRFTAAEFPSTRTQSPPTPPPRGV